MLTEEQIQRMKTELGCDVSPYGIGFYNVYFHYRHLVLCFTEYGQLSVDIENLDLWPKGFKDHYLFTEFDMFIDLLSNVHEAFTKEEFARNFAANVIMKKLKEKGYDPTLCDLHASTYIKIEIGCFKRSISLCNGRIGLNVKDGFILPDYGIKSVNHAAEWLLDAEKDANQFFSHVEKLCQ